MNTRTMPYRALLQQMVIAWTPLYYMISVIAVLILLICIGVSLFLPSIQDSPVLIGIVVPLVFFVASAWVMLLERAHCQNTAANAHLVPTVAKLVKCHNARRAHLL